MRWLLLVGKMMVKENKAINMTHQVSIEEVPHSLQKVHKFLNPTKGAGLYQNREWMAYQAVRGYRHWPFIGTDLESVVAYIRWRNYYLASKN